MRPEPSTQYTPQGWANWGSYSPHYGSSSDRLTARHSFAWNTQEDLDLLAGVAEGASVGQLATRHSRSMRAISLRLITLNTRVLNRTKAMNTQASKVTPIHAAVEQPKWGGVSSKYTGNSAHYRDTIEGVFWEVMQPFGFEETRIQRGLLRYHRKSKMPAKPPFLNEIRKYLTELWGLGNIKN
jgi:hypothetical protein